MTVSPAINGQGSMVRHGLAKFDANLSLFSERKADAQNRSFPPPSEMAEGARQAWRTQRVLITLGYSTIRKRAVN